MVTDKITFEAAESVISDILVSENCIENIISKLDNHEKPNPEINHNQPALLSESDPCQKPELSHMNTDKTPVVEVLPFSGSVNSLHLSQDSTKSTLPPPASQQSTFGFPLSCANTFKQYVPAQAEETSRKPSTEQQFLKMMSNPKVMREIKAIHNYVNRSLKKNNGFKQLERKSLTRAKQLLFAIKQHHAVMCNSLKAECKLKNQSTKFRQALKKRINVLQKNQQKLLFLFQEHNAITKKIKVLETNSRKQAEMTEKGQASSLNLMLDNLPFLSKAKSIPNKLIISDDTQSESASTIYSFNSPVPNQKIREKFKNSFVRETQFNILKRGADKNGPTSSKFQVPISDLDFIPDNKMNPSTQVPMSELVNISDNNMSHSNQVAMSESTTVTTNTINKSSQVPVSNLGLISDNAMDHSIPIAVFESAITSTNRINNSSQMPRSDLMSKIKTNCCNELPMSKSAVSTNEDYNSSQKFMPQWATSTNKTNHFSQAEMSDSATMSYNKTTHSIPDESHVTHTAIPIGTTADFVASKLVKDISLTQLSDNHLAWNPVFEELEDSENTNQNSQNGPVPSGKDLFSTPANIIQTISSNEPRSFEVREMEELFVDSPTEVNNSEINSVADRRNFCGVSSQITDSLTHLTLIEDEELVQLDCILPSYRNTDPLGRIDFPKFLWEGFYKWP